MPPVSLGNLNQLNVILPHGGASETGITAYYPSIPSGTVLRSLGGGSIVGNYQIVQSNFVSQTQQPTLNFLPPLFAVNDPGNGSTDVGASNGGIVGNVTAPPLFASWTQVNWIGSTSGANSGGQGLPTVYLFDAWGGGTGQPIRGLSLARIGAVGASYTLTAAILPLFPIASTPECGIYVSDGTKLIAFANGSTSGNNINEVKTYATVSSSPSNLTSSNSTFGCNAFVWYQIKSDTVHRTYSVSVDGYNFLPRLVETIAASTLINTETVMGCYVAPVSTAGTGITIASWLQTSP